MKKWIFIYAFFGLLFVPNAILGFTLTVTPTSESCAGNGTLTFNPANVNAGGTIVYIVYKLPNTTTPFTTQSGTFLGGLTAGDYRVVATETVGTIATTQQVDVTISNAIVPLTYTVQSLNQACSTTSNISVNINAGIAVSYEIFNGPITFPLQTSNTFSGLPVGVYKIRVFDNCGNGIVQTFTVVLNPTGLTIGAPVFTNTTPPSCTTTIATNTITPATGTVIGYPLAIQYTVNPPGGGSPISFNSNLITGNATSQAISTSIPSYVNQSYDYTMTITDACGSVFTSNFIVDFNITLLQTITPIGCDQNYFSLTTTNFTPPYSINFVNSPAGFNPITNFNSNYPGPYNTATIDFGSTTNPTPKGTYEVTITDACGRTFTRIFTVLPMPPLPEGVGINNGCLTNSGRIFITIPNYDITTAIITSAPASYPFPLPHVVTSFINADNNLFMSPVPLGDYVFQLTDECGDTITPLNVNVPVYVDLGLASDIRSGCDLNKGSVSISSLNGKLTSISITAAPASFSATLPFNGNTNIATNGIFYMNNFPTGQYTFSCIDECNYSNSITVFIEGYTIVTNTFSLQANCGSFNLPLNFVSNATTGQKFWLQKLISPNVWGHPGTEVIYPDGSIPDDTNSFGLQNNTTNLNLAFNNGTYRIVRNFYTYYNGSEFNSGAVTTIDKSCIDILSPLLTFSQALQIVDVYRMPCSASGNLDVIVSALGTLPLHYTITEKDGLPFSFDNGNSNIFVNLPPGVYTFQVEDNCGNITSRPLVDVNALLSLVTITQPDDIVDCQATITGNETFDITSASATILGAQSPTDYTVSYYTSLADAQSASNSISNLTNFNPTTNPQTIYVRVIFNQLPNCYQTASFDLIVGQIPDLILDPTYLDCTTSPIVIDASSTNLPTTTYEWSNGVTGPIVTISQLGETNLTVTATNLYGSNNQPCTNTKDITVTISQLPVVDHIETVDWTDTENSITVFTTNNGAFEYSIDGINYQDDATFSNLWAGLYTVYIRDKKGCGTLEQQVWLLNYPKFFTPNGDGFNDTWYIKNSQFEPNFKVEIFDRFGKFITQFDSTSLGWDGNYNNKQLLSTDYWFVVYREDGRIYKGHFAMKR